MSDSGRIEDVGHDVGGGDQVDVVAADFLDVQHYIGQIFVADLFAATFMGNRPVLAKHTAQIAVGEKDGAGTVFTRQGYFLAKMRMGRIDRQPGCCPAKSLFSCHTIYPALSRAQPALFENSPGLFHSLCQLALVF